MWLVTFNCCLINEKEIQLLNFRFKLQVITKNYEDDWKRKEGSDQITYIYIIPCWSKLKHIMNFIIYILMNHNTKRLYLVNSQDFLIVDIWSHRLDYFQKINIYIYIIKLILDMMREKSQILCP